MFLVMCSIAEVILYPSVNDVGISMVNRHWRAKLLSSLLKWVRLWIMSEAGILDIVQNSVMLRITPEE